jgi:type II secretory pathway pseudopilin PulG
MIRNQEHASGDHRRGQCGSTLVEVMVACLILMIVAVAGAAYLYQSQSALAYQSQKRTALEAGNARLENIRATSYTNLQSLLPTDHNLHYLKQTGTTWLVSNSDPGETANVNGALLPLTTTVQYGDVNGGVGSYDYLVVAVSISYRQGPGDRITLQSIYSP